MYLYNHNITTKILTMKTNIFLLLCILSAAFLFTACPYTSKVPITGHDVKINKQLLGKWVKADDVSAENPEFYEIKKYDKFKYDIEKNSWSSSDSSYTKETYISHLSVIEDITFINMQKDGTGDYYLHKIIIEKKDFTLFEVTDNIDETFNTSEELYAFVKKNMHLSFFYNKDEIKYFKQ